MILAISLHVLAAVFWAGTTFALARTGGDNLERLAGPQIGAAAVAILSGGFLWSRLHAGGYGPWEQVLTVGALSAIIAFLAQAGVGVPLLRRLRQGRERPSQGRAALVQRIASGLLAIAAVCMAAGRYV